MGLTKPNQQLRRDLNAAASTLDDLAHELYRTAQGSSDEVAIALLERIGRLHQQIDQLRAYADEVKVGRIVRARAD